MISCIRSVKALAIGGAAFVAASVGANAAYAAPVYLAPETGAIPGGSGISVKMGVVDLGNVWAVSLRNESTTASHVTGWNFEQGLSQSGPFSNIGSMTTGGNQSFNFDASPTSPGGDWAGSAFGFNAAGAGIAQNDPGVFWFRMNKAAGDTYTAADIADLFNTGGFRVAVNIVLPEIGSYVLASGPQLSNEPGDPQDPGTGVVAPTPAALGTGLAMLTVLTMKRRRETA